MKRFCLFVCIVWVSGAVATPSLGQTTRALPNSGTVSSPESLAQKTNDELKAELAALQAELKRRRTASKVTSISVKNSVATNSVARAEFTPADLAKKHADLAQSFYVRSD